jgi:hypothetical protein
MTNGDVLRTGKVEVGIVVKDLDTAHASIEMFWGSSTSATSTCPVER